MSSDFFTSILPPKPDFLKSKKELDDQKEQKGKVQDSNRNDNQLDAASSTENPDSNIKADKEKSSQFTITSLLPPKPEFLKSKKEIDDHKSQESESQQSQTEQIDSNSSEQIASNEKQKDTGEVDSKAHFTLKTLLPPKPEFLKTKKEKGESEESPREGSSGFPHLPSFNLPLPSVTKKSQEIKAELQKRKQFPVVRAQQNDSLNFLLTLGALMFLAYSLACTLNNICSFLYAITLGSSEAAAVESKLAYNAISAAVHTLIMFILLTQCSQRVLGYIASTALRYFLQKEHKEPGAFRVHIGWIAVRGFLDRTEVVFGDVVWHNHPTFTKSPYFLRIKELSVSLDFFELIETIRGRPLLKFQRIFVDTVEVYFEKAADKSLNALANIAQVGEEAEKSFVYKLMEDIITDIKSKVFRSKSTTENADATAADEDDDEEDTQTTSESTNTTSKTSSKPEMCVELEYMIVLNVVVHPLDLLSGEHMESTTATDITIPQIVIHRKHITGRPTVKGGDRVALTGKKFGDKLGDKIGDAVLAHNKLKIISLLGSITANRLKTNVQSIFRGTSGVVSTVGSAAVDTTVNVISVGGSAASSTVSAIGSVGGAAVNVGGATVSAIGSVGGAAVNVGGAAVSTTTNIIGSVGGAAVSTLSSTVSFATATVGITSNNNNNNSNQEEKSSNAK